MNQPALIIHGGAGRDFRDSKRLRLIRKKLNRILNLSYQKLLTCSALDTVTFAVKLLEDDPEFNAGTGSMLQRDGKARLSASLMAGAALRFSAIINLEDIKNPILVAKALLGKTDQVLAGNGARRFAQSLGFKLADTRTSKSIRRWQRARERDSDTVGACALDKWGRLACATSTGGRGLEYPGRVSDSGMPIANYATGQCAVSATGIGEEIMSEGIAVRIATRVEDGMPLKKAFQKTFAAIRSRGHRMGAIGVDAKGHFAYETTTEVLFYGWRKGKIQGLF